MKAEEIKKMDIEELKNFKKKNFEERMKFIKYWADYVKTHQDKEWSSLQKDIIDSQIESDENSGRQITNVFLNIS